MPSISSVYMSTYSPGASGLRKSSMLISDMMNSAVEVVDEKKWPLLSFTIFAKSLGSTPSSMVGFCRLPTLKVKLMPEYRLTTGVTAVTPLMARIWRSTPSLMVDMRRPLADVPVSE